MYLPVLGTTSFVIDGQRFEVAGDTGAKNLDAVPKQLRLRLGIVCATDKAMILVPSPKKGNRLDVEILSA